MYITIRQLVVDLYQELYLWILNQELWIPFVLDHSVNYLDQITSSSDNPEQEITGLKDTIPKVQNLLIKYLMLSEKKLKDVTVYKDSKSATPLEVVLDLVWEHFLLQKSEKNILTESWKPFQFSLHLKFLIL